MRVTAKRREFFAGGINSSPPIYRHSPDDWRLDSSIWFNAGSCFCTGQPDVPDLLCGIKFRPHKPRDLGTPLPGQTWLNGRGLLAAMPERPWTECRKGKPINQNWLARRLKDFRIRPEKVGPELHRLNGYSKTSFADAFARYLPDSSFQTGHPDRAN
jgi:Protein of unknown function (DUF3631)